MKKKVKIENQLILGNLSISLITTVVLSLIVIIGSIFLMNYQTANLKERCSYTDPILIDLIAFLVATFLIVEGIYSLVKHKDESMKRQNFRIVRILIGFAILTIHTLQFMYKV